MSEVIYREPTADDITSIAERMRVADVMEVAASHGHTPLQALEHCIADATNAFTAVIDGVPEGIFGVTHRGGMSAEVWMLGTDGLVKDPELFRAQTSAILDSWASIFPVMHNFVDDENEVSKRWLKSVGFTLDEPRPYGAGQLPFRYFYRIGAPSV